jgi:hypothetical protein
VKVVLAATDAKKKVEMEKGKKRDREDSVTRLHEDGSVWFSQEGAVCEDCKKSGEQCLWRYTLQAKACRACHHSKRECLLPDARK